MRENKIQFCDCNVIHPERIAKVKDNMPDNAKLNQLAELYKNFADNTRIKILWALSIDEMCVCDLAAMLSMTISAVSHQLKYLRISNLVKFRKEGRVVYYSLADDHVETILEQGYEHINE